MLRRRSDGAPRKAKGDGNTNGRRKEGRNDTSTSSAADAEERLKKQTETCLVGVAVLLAVDVLTLRVYIQHVRRSTCIACPVGSCQLDPFLIVFSRFKLY